MPETQKKEKDFSFNLAEYFENLFKGIETGEKSVQEARKEVKGLSLKPLEPKTSLDVGSDQHKEFVDNLYKTWGRLSELNETDPDEFVRQRLQGKHWSKLMLVDFLTGFGQSNSKGIRQRLFDQETTKRAMRNKRLESVESQIKELGLADVSRLGARQRERAKQIDVGRDILEDEEERVAADKETKRDVAIEQLKHENQVKLENLKAKRNPSKHIQTTYSDNAISYPTEAGVLSFPGMRTVDATNPYNPRSSVSALGIGIIKDPPGAYERRRLAGMYRSAMLDVSNSLQEIYGEGDDTRMLPVLAKLRKPVSILGALGKEISETWDGWFKGFELGYHQDRIIREFNNAVLLRILERSGKQVTDKEREFVLTTLPTTFSNPSVFGLGVEMLRITVELDDARANIISALPGQVPVGMTWDEKQGKAVFIDRRDLLEKIHKRAVAMEKQKKGSGIKWMHENIRGDRLENAEYLFKGDVDENQSVLDRAKANLGL